MASKHPNERRKTRKSQTEPYAPPEHPDVNVPEQQFEGAPEDKERSGRGPAHPQHR